MRVDGRQKRKLRRGSLHRRRYHRSTCYYAENFHITTSGKFRTQSLVNAIAELGSERIPLSTDWPFENIDHAADWFDAAAIAEADRVKIGQTNAQRRFRLPRHP